MFIHCRKNYLYKWPVRSAYLLFCIIKVQSFKFHSTGVFLPREGLKLNKKILTAFVQPQRV